MHALQRLHLLFEIALILASLLRVPPSPQFGALVETHGQKGSQIRAGDMDIDFLGVFSKPFVSA